VQTKIEITNRAKEVIARCQKLASFTEEAGTTRRTFLSPPMRDCHAEFSRWVQPLGAKVWVDAAGNWRAYYPAENSPAPRLLLGSHLDTVPNAGAYDGVIGVVLGVSLLEALGGRNLPFGIEVVGFSEEEGVRFGTPFIGSRALVGRLDAELLARQDAQGISVRRAIENFGLDLAEIPQAALKGDTLGYLEFHIEQGPVLENLGQPLGIVESIVGQSRLSFTFAGRANHAGTTPMNLRKDALASAAEWITAVERRAQSIPGLVATVGSVQVQPGATNVIAGEVRATLDVRHSADDIRARTVEELIREAEQITQRRGLSVRWSTQLNQPAVPMDLFLTRQCEEAIRSAGCEPHRMVSGAGHDAMILAEKVPAAMIFLRSPGGISHNPKESVLVEDVARALESGFRLLDQLARSHDFQKRINRAQPRPHP
jgi:allantoate deiminase